MSAHLLRSHAREAEHANLLSDVVPLVRAAQRLQVVLQGLPHTDDALCHALHLLQPRHRSGTTPDDDIALRPSGPPGGGGGGSYLPLLHCFGFFSPDTNSTAKL